MQIENKPRYVTGLMEGRDRWNFLLESTARPWEFRTEWLSSDERRPKCGITACRHSYRHTCRVCPLCAGNRRERRMATLRPTSSWMPFIALRRANGERKSFSSGFLLRAKTLLRGPAAADESNREEAPELGRSNARKWNNAEPDRRTRIVSNSRFLSQRRT